ncbi:signal peptidase I [Streptococcus gallolyticus]|uniref:Signal peptidase I n=1 Tax=Streptococcus gallolyticus TaxID=315405 RepID=A0A368UE64_9STRE|nr:signal peptidase I [Streptococcus gallolyticus]RCW16194.1 signal peptidase I [Streptococcus gallolyticus]
MVKRDFIRNIIIGLIAILAVFLLKIFVFSTFKVHEDAANSYLSNGDVVVVNRNQTPQYKDFIVYEVDGTFYISRVIATAGESATVMDDILYIDNEVQEEPYISQIKSEYLSTSDNQQQAFTSDFSVNTITNDNYSEVPKGSYLVLNDNRQNTNDSRTFGLIKESQIRGVVTFKLLPLSTFGFITTE